MTTNTATITIIKFCITCQTDTERQPSNGKCKICLKKYAANYRAINKMKKLSEPKIALHAIRNANIIADRNAGASHHALAMKYKLGISYVQKLTTAYQRPDRIKFVELQTFGECSLYQERDRLAILDMACHFGVTGRRINADLIHSKGLS